MKEIFKMYLIPKQLLILLRLWIVLGSLCLLYSVHVQSSSYTIVEPNE